MVEKAFLNGNIIDAADATVSVRDPGFLYGAGLFETMRAYAGTVFALDDHLDRLLFSARALPIETSWTRSAIRDAICAVLDANQLADARLRLTLTTGHEGQSPRGTLLVMAEPYQGYPREYYEKGVLVVLSNVRQSASDPLAGHKTLSYFPRMLALNHARLRRAAEALWFTADNRLAEGCISNVFLVKNGRLATPPLETPVLAGVARKAVFEIAAARDIPTVETTLNVQDLLAADEIFLTNVIMGVMPVTSIEAHTVSDGKVGPLVNRLMAHYEQHVRDKCTPAGGPA